MRRFVYGLVAVSLACAGAKQEQKAESKPVEERQAVSNLTYFDLAACFPRKPAVPEVVTPEVVIGFLVAARPQVLECLVPPGSRGPAEETKVSIKTSVSVNGAENSVTGENLTADGEKCVKDALAGATADLKLPPPPAPKPAKKGAAPAAPAAPEPVVGEAQFVHLRDRLPSVTMNVNDTSDLLGTIRLGAPQWCDCFAPWKDAPPRTLTAKVMVEHANPAPAGAADGGTATAASGDMVNPSEVVIEPTGDANADKVAACVTDKVKALTFKNPKNTGGRYGVPAAPLMFVHSGVSAPMEGVGADIRFIQLDGLSGQRNADAAIAIGVRSQAVRVYDDLVKKYQATKDWTLVSDLEKKCAALLKADDAWGKSLEDVLDIDKRTLAVITELKAKDPAYAEAETKATEKVGATEKDLATAKGARSADEKACPKRTYK